MDQVGTLPPPAGFIRLPMGELADFTARNLPLHIRTEDGHLIGGFRVGSEHCNPAGTCHGGMIATFCDILLAFAGMFEGRLETMILPTISLSIDYLAPARPGAWMEARADIIKTTRTMLFAQAVIHTDGAPSARVNGVFKVPTPDPSGIDTGAWLRELLGV